MVDLGDRLLQVVVILFSKLHDTVLSVQSLSDNFVCLNELVDLTGQFVVLVADDADVVVHRVNLDLEVGVVLEECAVGVTGTLKLFAHVKELVLLLADLHL